MSLAAPCPRPEISDAFPRFSLRAPARLFVDHPADLPHLLSFARNEGGIGEILQSLGSASVRFKAETRDLY